ncbi:heavy metal translocating P-type ATPase metal-binding domain-containing protein [Campylobacter sp. RM12640]|uniref:heavy metal translocating P-type ATPase n=1 Tax=unclassified Campylobacter TaxID=2593542 RepID=UPI0030151145|nr:heavy metal translocating P-type ATPase metal-binding domain-containing protein [Campylobacter sp. RM12640]MBZ7989782.1 heavy metal translocating P-type ATPase metal-binding domain-containing protein [Campylobacter sp. RM12635]
MKCSHCKIDFDKNSMIFQGNNAFCCNGCKNVFNLINENNLEDFYKNASNLSKINEQISYDENSFYIEKENNYEKILILIDNLHCAACVWLIEKMLLKNEGVLEININYQTKRASIEYNPNKTKAKDILNIIISLGYIPLAYNPNTTMKAKRTHIEFYSKLIVAIACVMNIMWLSIARYAGYFSSMEQSVQDIINFAEFVLCTPVLFYSASSMFKSAISALKNKILNMDCLVTFGASLVYIYSIYAMFARLSYVYFDSVAMIICFVFIGRFLEQLSYKQALENIDFLSDLLNASVNIVKNDKIEKISVTKIKKDDVIRVFLGDKILIDGTCKSLQARLNLSAITGESELVDIKQGDFIKSASMVECASFDYIANCTFQDSYINKLAKLLNKTKKSNLEKLTDKIGVYFCYAIFSIAFLCFLYNMSDIQEAIIRSVSLLIIACPCALALSAPVGNLLCLHEALKLKVLFKNSNYIENLSKIDIAVFDKTGVLTKSKLELLSQINLNDYEKSILKAILDKNNHFIASSLNEYIKDTKPSLKDFKLTQLSGLGVIAEFENDKYYLGSAKLLNNHNINANSKNETEMFFAKNDEILEHFVFSNQLNDDALELINYFKKQNIKVIMLSGDKQKPCEKIAKELQIDDLYSECLPEDKLKIIQNLSKNNKVLMVGDGINDALALKLALVSISFKNATNLALNSSDIIMLDNKLIGIKNSHLLAKRTYRLIKTNLALSFLYNIISIPLAFMGLINPLIASIFMSLSSICVILNSIRIKNYAKKIKNLK